MIDVDYNEYKATLEENMRLIKENHKLKEKIKDCEKFINERHKNLVKEHIDTITRNEEYRARIDKAIEYIKAVGVLPKQLDSFVLLEILQGSEKSERRKSSNN